MGAIKPIHTLGQFPVPSMRLCVLQADCPRPGYNRAMVHLEGVSDADIERLVKRVPVYLGFMYHVFDGDSREMIFCNCKTETNPGHDPDRETEHDEGFSGIKIEEKTKRIVSYNVRGAEVPYVWGAEHLPGLTALFVREMRKRQKDVKRDHRRLVMR